VVLPIAHLLTSTATIERWTGGDAWSKPTFSGTTASVDCMFVEKIKRVRDAQMVEVVSSSHLICLEDVRSEDRIWPPGATTSNVEEARTPVAISRPRTPTGDTVTIVYFG